MCLEKSRKAGYMITWSRILFVSYSQESVFLHCLSSTKDYILFLNVKIYAYLLYDLVEHLSFFLKDLKAAD